MSSPDFISKEDLAALKEKRQVDAEAKSQAKAVKKVEKSAAEEADEAGADFEALSDEDEPEPPRKRKKEA